MTIEHQNVDLLNRMHGWANRILNAHRLPFSRSDVEQYFAPDARMTTNNQLRCRGIEAHVKHFKELQKNTRSLVLHPFEIVAAQEDRVGVHFRIDAEFSDGSKARILNAGFFQLQNTKIVSCTQLTYFEGD